MEEEKVIIIELVTRDDGTVGHGNSYEVPLSEAIQKVEAGEAVAMVPEEGGSFRVVSSVPDEWLR